MLYNKLPDIKINDVDKQSMAEYLYNEITQCQSDRGQLVDLWVDIQKLYERVDIPEKANFPFENAAHIMIPVTATYVEQLHSRIMNTLYAPEDPYVVKPTVDELLQYAKACRRWITWAVQNELNMEEVDYTLILELLKLGNMVAKVVYTKELKTLYKFNDTLGDYEESVEIMKDNPEVIPISINDFLFPVYARSLDEAQWKAHRIRLDWNTVKGRAHDKTYNADAVRNLATWYGTNTDSYDQTREELSLSQPSALYEFEFYEVWFRYPLKFKPTLEGSEGSLPEDQVSNILNFAPAVDLVAVFHKDSKTFLRLQYNWYPLGLDPFEHQAYVRREFQVLGIGIGQMAYPFQIEVSTMHNQRLDNATVANTVMYKYRSDSTIPAQIVIKPGGGIPVDKMEDLETFQIGQKYDSTIQEEQHTLSFLQERIGSRELEMDAANLGRMPATTTLATMSERGRRLDNVIRSVRRFKRRVMLKCILLYQQYYPIEQLMGILGMQDGAAVAEFLNSVSPQQIWDGMGLEVTATTSTTSKELDRQNKMALFNLLVQYYGQTAQYTTAIVQAPPPIQSVFVEILQGLSTFVKELLEDFNIRNRGEFIVNMGGLQAATQQVAAAAAQAPIQPGGVQAAPGAGGQPTPPGA